MSEPIKFYSVLDEYGCFSNFADYPIQLKGKLWPTSEHYFQAQKFCGTKHETEIRKASKPMLAAQMGRDQKRPLRRDWDHVKDNIMREAVLAKFTQHDGLRQILLATGDAKIIEHTDNDRYWADGSGKNMLGIILMEVRSKLRNQRVQSVD